VALQPTAGAQRPTSDECPRHKMLLPCHKCCADAVTAAHGNLPPYCRLCCFGCCWWWPLLWYDHASMSLQQLAGGHQLHSPLLKLLTKPACIHHLTMCVTLRSMSAMALAKGLMVRRPGGGPCTRNNRKGQGVHSYHPGPSPPAVGNIQLPNLQNDGGNHTQREAPASCCGWPCCWYEAAATAGDRGLILQQAPTYGCGLHCASIVLWAAALHAQG
jgi:hypothetical protein